ncbi:hypothetical protein B0H34DRAFT_713237 [Crassisporium funariophilum]|nr:hypothetical protein B0H34DRAFT_713237 [Crassisporium funariophilum]
MAYTPLHSFDSYAPYSPMRPFEQYCSPWMQSYQPYGFWSASPYPQPVYQPGWSYQLRSSVSLHPSASSKSRSRSQSDYDFLEAPPSPPTSARQRRFQRGSLQHHTSNLHNHWSPISHSYHLPQRHPPGFLDSAAFFPFRLIRRPRSCRATRYRPPSKQGLGKYLENIRSSFLSGPPCLRQPFLRMSPLLLHTDRRRGALSHDLLLSPELDGISFLCLNGPPNRNIYQLATSPPVQRLDLWHRELPGLVRIEAAAPTGITVRDILFGIYEEMMRSIGEHEYYTEELTYSQREMLGAVFRRRCGGDPEEIANGIRRIDFLGQNVCLTGLKRSRKGLWEMKTERQRMTLD